MIKQKIFASGFIVLGLLVLSFGIVQVIVNDFPAFGRWKTQSFYATLKYLFGPYAVYVNAWIWLVIGVLIICSGIKDLQVKSIDSNVQKETSKRTTRLGRLRNRISRSKNTQGERTK
jgi:hypothetical protein